MRASPLVLCLLLAGCISPPSTPSPSPSAASATLLVASPAFEDGGEIPIDNTCDGDNLSPPLAFVVTATNATHLALIVYDPDAPIPQAPTRNITHWLLWNAPLQADGTAAFAEGDVPEGTVQGKNENGASAYMGPCPPPVSSAHRYVFHAFALSAPLDLPEGSDRATLDAALNRSAVAEGALVGMYARALPPT